MARYRKKPVEVEAIQWTGRNFDALADWVGHQNVLFAHTGDGALTLWIEKSQARGLLPLGNWVIAERDGAGFYPCTNEQFIETYEQIDVAVMD